MNTTLLKSVSANYSKVMKKLYLIAEKYVRTYVYFKLHITLRELTVKVICPRS